MLLLKLAKQFDREMFPSVPPEKENTYGSEMKDGQYSVKHQTGLRSDILGHIRVRKWRFLPFQSTHTSQPARSQGIGRSVGALCI